MKMLQQKLINEMNESTEELKNWTREQTIKSLAKNDHQLTTHKPPIYKYEYTYASQILTAWLKYERKELATASKFVKQWHRVGASAKS
jgi:hypothetical protein